MEPYFTVLISTKNRAEYLRAALQSVFEQTFQDFEVVVVNDASTDHTAEVLSEFAVPRLMVINYNSNSLSGAARNRGIEVSKGQYVAFLDDDDTWMPNNRERVAYVIESDPGVGLVCHDQQYVRPKESGGGIWKRRSQYGPNDTYKGDIHDYMLLEGNQPATSATVASRQHLVEIGGFSEDPSLATVEDYDLWLRLSRVCRFVFVRDVLGTQRYHTSNTTGNVERHLRDSVSLLDENFRGRKSTGRQYPAHSIRRRYAIAYYGAARQHHRNGSTGASFATYLRALRTSPFYSRTYAGLGLLLIAVMGSVLRSRGK
ncbi:MAG: glycosyltransferase family 2 protein [Dehalococcoidia bacterium]|nr:glycosyltransferase family 2 protein [Dehalococcoidia bacterium]